MSSLLSPSFFSGSRPIAVVAGGAGFVGSFVCEKLLQKNIKVICVDNWQTGLQQNIPHLLSNKNFCLLEKNIAQKFTRQILKANYVLQLSGVEDFLNGEKISLEGLETNSVGTKNLLLLAKRAKAKFLLATTLNYFEDKSLKKITYEETRRFAQALTDEYRERGVNTRTVCLGDVFGPRMTLSPKNFLGRVIKQGVYGESLEVSEKESIYFPLYIDDAVEGIIRALFASGTKGKTIYLLGNQTSDLEIAQAVLRFFKDSVQIKYSTFGLLSRASELSEGISGQKSISWEPKVSLEKGIVDTIYWFLANKQRLSEPKKALDYGQFRPTSQDQLRNTFSKVKESLTSSSSFWGESSNEVKKTVAQVRTKNKGFNVFLSLVVFAPIFWLLMMPFLVFYTGLGSLYLTQKFLKEGQANQAITWSSQAGFWFGQAKSGFARWDKIPGLEGKSRQFSNKSVFFLELSKTAKTGSSVLLSTQDLVSGITGDDSFNIQPVTDELFLELKDLEQQLGFLDAEVKKQKIDLPLKDLELAHLRKAISGASDILPFLENLLGLERRKTYLVLLQNNNELRPTGGFIGSYALVTFEKGRMINLEVQDVYTADGQLKGHVEPPKPVKQYLGEAGWFLRDSNWSPDFPTSAARAVWFFDKETGQKVDGVLAIDLEYVRKILLESGPLELSDFGEIVTGDNLYEKAQRYSEKGFFPGSTGKKDFLTALTRGVLDKILSDPSKYLAATVHATALSLGERHIAFWTTQTQVNAVLAKSGWDGALANLSCELQDKNGCITDYLQLVDANLGVNKSNYFLTKTHSLEVSVTQDKVLHKLTTTYQNNSQEGVWPGGDYKNYVRLYTPGETQITGAILFDPKTGVQENLEMEKVSERGKSSYGTLAPVPAGESRQLILSWSLPVKKGAGRQNHLVLFWQKQMGTLADLALVKVNLPEPNLHISAFPEPHLTSISSIGYNTTLAHDFVTQITWQEKLTP